MNEQQASLLLNSSPDALVIYDNEGKATYLNPAFEQIFGWTADELLGKRIDFVPEANQAETAEFIQTVLAGGTVTAADTQRLTKDGRIIDVQLSAAMTWDDKGNPLNTIVTLRDVTQQRQSERERELLLASEYEQRLLAETLSEVTIALTVHTSLTAVLDEILIQARRLVPYTTANIALLEENSLRVAGSRGYDDIGKEDFVSDLVQHLDTIPLSAQAIASRKPLLIHETQEHQDSQQNEQTSWIRSYIGMPLALQERVVGMLRVNSDQPRHFTEKDVLRLTPLTQVAAIAIDNTRLYEEAQAEINKRKAAEAALEKRVEQRTAELQRSRQQANTLIQLNPYAIIEWDKNFHVTVWNPGAANIFGYTAKEAMSQHARFIIPEDVWPLVDDVWQMLLAQEGGTNSINENITQDGRRIICNWYNTPLVDAKGKVTGVASFVEDITEREQAEASLAKRNQLLEILNQLSREASFTLEIGTSLNRVCQSITELFNTTSGYISNFNLEEKTLQVVGEYFAPEANELERQSDLGFIYDMEKDFGYDEQRLQNLDQITVFHVDDAHIPLEEREHLQQYGTHTAINGMLHHQGKPIGVLEMYESRGRREFTDEEIEFFRAITNQVAVIIDNANLYNELANKLTERSILEDQIQESLARRGREMQLLNQLTREVSLASSLNELYNQVVTLIKEQFDYYYVQLFRYNTALNTAELVVGYGEVGDRLVAMHHSVPMGVGLIGRAAATGETVLISDVASDTFWQPNPLLPRTRGEIAVPIKLGAQILGVLDVQSDIVNALDENDQILLEGVGGQIAVAIESANLRQGMADRLRELSSLQHLMTREGWQEYQVGEHIRAPGYVFSRAEVEPLIIDALSHQNGGQQAGTNGRTLSQPLAIRGTTIGTIGIEDDPERPLSDEDKDFITAVSEQVAEALEIARLLDTTQEALSTQERLSTELRTVAEVSTVAATIMERNRLLQSVVDLTKTSFDLYHAHIYLLNEPGDTLSLTAGADQVGRLMTLEENHIPLRASSIVASAARSRQAIVENDTHASNNFLPHPLLPHTRSELAIPMIVGERLVGVLDVQADSQNRFAEQDVLIMRTLASQVAVAVQNAEQYTEQVELAEKLREVEQLKSEFLASMSHELRTPLNSIIGFADVLLEGLDGPLNDRMEQDVRLIRDSGDHLRNLIGDILDMSKIEAGKMELRYEEIDIRQLAQDVIATATPLVSETDIRLHLNIVPNLFNIHADRTRLRQIMWNIMGNAIKFTSKGSVTLTLQSQENNLLVSIRDTGIGISPEHIPIVFEQFRQIDGALNRTAEGTGLGMPITKKLVELHGGEIWVESVVNEGSTFWFTIPRFPAPATNVEI